jgi:hypothetical protein
MLLTGVIKIHCRTASCSVLGERSERIRIKLNLHPNNATLPHAALGECEWSKGVLIGLERAKAGAQWIAAFLVGRKRGEPYTTHESREEICKSSFYDSAISQAAIPEVGD